MGLDLSKEEVPIFSGWIALDVQWKIIINSNSCLLSSEHEKKMEFRNTAVSNQAWSTTGQIREP